jgi:hypothetical protein
MLKHIVLFKLKDQAEGGSKEQNATRLIEMLHALKSAIPQVRHLEAGANVVPSDAAYDVAIYSEFKNEQDLKIYAQHPEHIRVVEFVKKVVASRVAVDYTT